MFSQACVKNGPGPGGGVQSRGMCIPACTEADTPKQSATAADGTHPTVWTLNDETDNHVCHGDF